MQLRKAGDTKYYDPEQARPDNFLDLDANGKKYFIVLRKMLYRRLYFDVDSYSASLLSRQKIQ